MRSSVKRKKERKRRADPKHDKVPDTHDNFLIVSISLLLNVIAIIIILEG